MSEATDFLRILDPNGYHNLVAINSKDGRVTGHTFAPGEWTQIDEWIGKCNGSHNLYASVNEPRPDAPHGKLQKNHIGAIRALFADVDPPRDKSTDEGRAEVARKAAALAHSACPPSAVIDSGNGYQFLWMLNAKLDPSSSTEWAEAQGRAIRHAVGGDAVQNIDRIMRLPGTINYPDAKKAALGRVKRQAALIGYEPRSYDAAALGAWAPPRSADAAETDADEAVVRVMGEIDMSAARSGTNDQLRLWFASVCRNNPALDAVWSGTADIEDKSGSGWRAALAREMARAGGFTAQDYADVAWSWGLAVSPGADREEKLTLRALARDWARCGLPYGRDALVSKWFDPAVDSGVVESIFPVEDVVDAGSHITATPYRWIEPALMPRRKTLYGGHYTRKFVSVTVAPSKVGKTALSVVEALAMASGKPLLGREVVGGPLRVWLWNGEDPLEELERRLAAAMLVYGLTRADVGDRLFVDSGRDMEIVLADGGAGGRGSGARIIAPVESKIYQTLFGLGIDVLMVDPFISSHRVPENDNGAIDLVAKRWAKIADRANCSVELVHHVRKLNGGEVTVEDGRGAVALLAASRSARALARMTADEARRAGVSVDVARRLFRFADVSSNIALPGDADAAWLELSSVLLGNGDLECAAGDSVGVVRRWSGDAGLGGVAGSTGERKDILRLINEEGPWRLDMRAGDAWVGVPISIALGLDRDDELDQAQIKSTLRALLKSGEVEQYAGKDKNRNARTFIRVAFTGAFS